MHSKRMCILIRYMTRTSYLKIIALREEEGRTGQTCIEKQEEEVKTIEEEEEDSQGETEEGGEVEEEPGDTYRV